MASTIQLKNNQIDDHQSCTLPCIGYSSFCCFSSCTTSPVNLTTWNTKHVAYTPVTLHNRLWIANRFESVYCLCFYSIHRLLKNNDCICVQKTSSDQLRFAHTCPKHTTLNFHLCASIVSKQPTRRLYVRIFKWVGALLLKFIRHKALKRLNQIAPTLENIRLVSPFLHCCCCYRFALPHSLLSSSFFIVF